MTWELWEPLLCMGHRFPLEQAQSSGWRPPKPADTSGRLRAGTGRALLPADVPKGSCSTQEGCDGREAMLTPSTASFRPWDTENPWVEAVAAWPRVS